MFYLSRLFFINAVEHWDWLFRCRSSSVRWQRFLFYFVQTCWKIWNVDNRLIFTSLIFLHILSRLSTRSWIEVMWHAMLSRLLRILVISLSWSCFNLSGPDIPISSDFSSILFCFDALNIFLLSVTHLSIHFVKVSLSVNLSFLFSNILVNKK